MINLAKTHRGYELEHQWGDYTVVLQEDDIEAIVDYWDKINPKPAVEVCTCISE